MVNEPEPGITFHILPVTNTVDNTGGAGPPRSRINEGLKTKPLTHDACPEEFRSWAKCFKAFYTSSLLHNWTVEEQQACLNVCLDLTLETAISLKIDPDTTTIRMTRIVPTRTPIFQDEDIASNF